jgi:hypothetical protein
MAPAPAAPSVDVAQDGVAAGPSLRPAAAEEIVIGSIFEAYEPRFAEDVDANASEEDDGLDEAAPLAAAPSSTTAPSAPPTLNTLLANTASAPLAPTPEQFTHLVAIYQRLSPAERAVAQRAVAQMDVAMRSRWITALSAKSIDEATSDIRGVLAQMQNVKRA